MRPANSRWRRRYSEQVRRHRNKTLKDKSKTDKPFFIYWASYALQITGSKEHQDDPGVDKVNAQASMMVLHNKHVQSLLDEFKELRIKVHIKEGHGGLPGMDFYNVKRDPGEKYGQLYPGLFAVTPIQKFIGSHMGMIKKFPHRDPSESQAQHKGN